MQTYSTMPWVKRWPQNSCATLFGVVYYVPIGNHNPIQSKRYDPRFYLDLILWRLLPKPVASLLLLIFCPFDSLI